MIVIRRYLKSLHNLLLIFVFLACNQVENKSKISQRSYFKNEENASAQSERAAEAQTLQLTASAEEEAEKNRLIKEIFEIRANIQQRLPILETEQDRLYKLTNELTDDNTYGCHYDEQINSVQLVIDGSQNPLVSMGTFSDYQPEPVGGSPTALEFRFGGFSFTVDPATEILGGSQYEVDTDFTKQQLTIGSIEYVEVKKLGISYNQERRCRQQFVVMEECDWQVSEEHVYYINSIQLIVNGLVVYKGDGLNWKFDRKRQIWQDSNLRSDENWVKLMIDNNCEKVN